MKKTTPSIETNPEGPTRRDFCGHAWRVGSLAALTGSLGPILQGCGGGGSPNSPSGVSALPVVSGTVAGNSVTLTIDSTSPLAAVGGAALVQTSSGPLLVAHTAQDTFVALNGTCTHALCTITGLASPNYVCPCHGSQFSTNGQVVSGPAPRALREHQTQFTNSVLTIAL